MSRSWRKGSTREWRKKRARVLLRDGYKCQLQLSGCTQLATHAHHTKGRAITGDDETFIVAACRHCNLTTGDPSRHNPEHRRISKW